MPDDDSTVYLTRQVADRLGLGTAMVRKYAVCFEKLTGQDIPIKRRDGRQFSPEHYAVIAHAKALVDGNQGLSVETALKMALGTAEIGADALTPPTGRSDYSRCQGRERGTTGRSARVAPGPKAA